MDLITYRNKAIITNKWLTCNPVRMAELAIKRDAKIWVTADEAIDYACEADYMHMAVGMASELNELISAINNKDQTNISEELGDTAWYTVNLASMNDITLQAQLDVGHYDLLSLVSAVSKVTNQVKRVAIYGETFNKEALTKALQHLIEILYNFAWSPNFAKVDLPKALDRNINKLQKVRYKLGYSDEAAQNRDLAAEQKELE